MTNLQGYVQTANVTRDGWVVHAVTNAILVPLVLIVKTNVIHAVTLHVRELTEIVQMAA